MTTKDVPDLMANLEDSLAKARTSAATTVAKSARLSMTRVPWLNAPRPVPEYQTELPWVENDDEIIDAIVGRILAADTMEEALTLNEPTEFKELIGHRLRISGFVMRKSDLDEGPGAYAMISYDDVDSGEPGFASTGASGIVAALAVAYHKGAFPLECTVTAVVTNKAGHDNPLYLTRVETSF